MAVFCNFDGQPEIQEGQKARTLSKKKTQNDKLETEPCPIFKQISIVLIGYARSGTFH
jgi:hypothetical protein